MPSCHAPSARQALSYALLIYPQPPAVWSRHRSLLSQPGVCGAPVPQLLGVGGVNATRGARLDVSAAGRSQSRGAFAKLGLSSAFLRTIRIGQE